MLSRDAAWSARVEGLEVGFPKWGSRVQGLRVKGLGFRFQGSGFRFQG